METLFKKHKMYISQVSMDIVRDTMQEVHWDKQLLIPLFTKRRRPVKEKIPAFFERYFGMESERYFAT